MPGSAMEVLPTVIASAATTKNHPPDMDIIMFQTREGIAKGTSMRQKRAHPFNPNILPASIISGGTVLSD